MNKTYPLIILLIFTLTCGFSQNKDLILKTESTYIFGDSTTFQARSKDNLKWNLHSIRSFNRNGDILEEKRYNKNTFYATYEYQGKNRIKKSYSEAGSINRIITQTKINNKYYIVKELDFHKPILFRYPVVKCKTERKISYDNQANKLSDISIKDCDNKRDTTRAYKYLYSTDSINNEQRIDLVNVIIGDTSYTKIKNINQSNGSKRFKAVYQKDSLIAEEREEIFRDTISDFYHNFHKIMIENDDTTRVYHSETLIIDSLNEIKTIIYFIDLSVVITKIVVHNYLGKPIKLVKSNYTKKGWNLETVLNVKLDKHNKESIFYRTEYRKGKPYSTQITLKEYEYY